MPSWTNPRNRVEDTVRSLAAGFGLAGFLVGFAAALVFVSPNPRDLVEVYRMAPERGAEYVVRVWDGDGHEVLTYSVDPAEPIASAINWRGRQ